MIVSSVYGRRPASVAFAFRTDGDFLLPVKSKCARLEARALLRLPLVVRPGGTIKIRPVSLLALEQRLRVEVTGGHELGFGEQVLHFERFVYKRGRRLRLWQERCVRR